MRDSLDSDISHWSRDSDHCLMGAVQAAQPRDRGPMVGQQTMKAPFPVPPVDGVVRYENRPRNAAGFYGASPRGQVPQDAMLTPPRLPGEEPAHPVPGPLRSRPPVSTTTTYILQYPCMACCALLPRFSKPLFSAMLPLNYISLRNGMVACHLFPSLISTTFAPCKDRALSPMSY